MAFIQLRESPRNLIENLWDYLDRKMRLTPITSKIHLKQRLQEEWAGAFRIPI